MDLHTVAGEPICRAGTRETRLPPSRLTASAPDIVARR